MTTTPDTLPKLTADGTRIVAVVREPQPEINDDFAGGLGEYVRYGELPGAGQQRAAEIVRRCNDYPALAARLERAMGLLRRLRQIDAGAPGISIDAVNELDAIESEAAVLLAEHEQDAGT